MNRSTGEPFAEYEVACKYRLPSSKVTKESTLKWSVWQRFSTFEKLDSSLRKTLGWHMNAIAFPPKHSLTFNKLSLDFIEVRCVCALCVTRH